ncbi:hypothetical protein ACFL23_01170 [Patescibacteria group bacterium]
MKKRSSLIFCIMVAVIFFGATAMARTYTLDADFDEGTLVGVEHETVHDQLQLTEENVTLPFIWVPNMEGTVSKINTETGDELGRYWVAPHNGDPSRTTVDLEGSCFVGLRSAGTVVKIGLYEAGNWIDRNGNGTCQTSKDLNNDGDITGAEILPWGEDECVLYEVVLISGKEGTFAPGDYTGGYDMNYWGTSPRGLAIDASNNLWAGTSSSQNYYYIDGATGAILQTVDVSQWGHSAYGAVIDKNGILWSACLGNHILRLDPSNLTNTIKISLNHTYGIGLDYADHLFVAGNSKLTKIDINDMVNPIMWTKPARTMRGVVCTSDNDVWVAGMDASSQYAGVSRYDNDGNLIVTIGGFNSPSGVAVDAEGKVWGTNISDTYIRRIDTVLNVIDLSKSVIGSSGHYTYSDMTGMMSRNITTKIGTWTVIHDSGVVNTPWGFISWTSQEPDGTSISVKGRSSNDLITWSAWEDATNGLLLNATSNGQYVEMEIKLQTQTDESPILYDLTVEPRNLPPDCSNASASEDCLWQPNHRFVPIEILGVTDPDGDPITIEVSSITSDEATATCKGTGGKKHSPDAMGVGTDAPEVRRERSGREDGRVYVINFIATDGNGGECQGSVAVKVPHDYRHHQSDDWDCPAVDSGQIYDATAIN